MSLNLCINKLKKNTKSAIIFLGFTGIKDDKRKKDDVKNHHFHNVAKHADKAYRDSSL